MPVDIQGETKVGIVGRYGITSLNINYILSIHLFSPLLSLLFHCTFSRSISVWN